MKAVARANANIAFVKYWGNSDAKLNLPANSSVSMNLDGLYCVASVEFEKIERDVVMLQGEHAPLPLAEAVSNHLDRVRRIGSRPLPARVELALNFPMRCGLASSAALFASLTVAACASAGLRLEEKEMSRLARRGSGSACRSVPAGFVEWRRGKGDGSSFARSLAPPDHWDLLDVVAIVDPSPKRSPSTDGHAGSATSPLHRARVSAAERLVPRCRRAIEDRDLAALGPVLELDATMMHAVAATGSPAIGYVLPRTLEVIAAARRLREEEKVPVFHTLDAGPNPHLITLPEHESEVVRAVEKLCEDVRLARPGGGATLVG